MKTFEELAEIGSAKVPTEGNLLVNRWGELCEDCSLTENIIIGLKVTQNSGYAIIVAKLPFSEESPYNLERLKQKV